MKRAVLQMTLYVTSGHALRTTVFFRPCDGCFFQPTLPRNKSTLVDEPCFWDIHQAIIGH